MTPALPFWRRSKLDIGVHLRIFLAKLRPLKSESDTLTLRRLIVMKQPLVRPYARVDCLERIYSSVSTYSASLYHAEILVATKCVSKTHGYEQTLQGVDESLKKFGLGRSPYNYCSPEAHKLMIIEYVDLFLIHNPHSGTEKRLATYKALQEARAAGKIHTVGVSN